MGNYKHDPCIKVQADGDWISFTISDEPEIKADNVKLDATSIKKIREWVLLNKDELLKFRQAGCLKVELKRRSIRKRAG